jgi:hypothetical protein
LRRRFWKYRVLQVGPDRPKHGRAKQHSGEQHSHDGRLSDARHGFAQQPPGQHQQYELGKENNLGRLGMRSLRCQSRTSGGKKRANATD